MRWAKAVDLGIGRMGRIGRVDPVCLLLPLLVWFSISLVVPSVAWAADTTSPISAHVFTPNTPDGNNGWYVSPVQVELTATDLESGVASLHWRIDDGGWEEEQYSESLNLAPNPSFEVPGEGQELASWDFSGVVGAEGTRASEAAYAGDFSAKVSAPQSGWSFWGNAGDYVVVTPWSNMTASVWVKAEGISGSGAQFRVYALSPAGATQITASDLQVSGTADWTRLSAEFVVSVSDAYGLYLEIGIDGVGTAWFDAAQITIALAEAKVEFTVPQNGELTLEYYAVDRMDNEETPHQTADLKVDTVAPGNWSDFETYRMGNDHTLISAITVEDESSGLDQDAAAFQYTVDGGLNWGYYFTLLACWEWSWVPDGWLSTFGSPYYGGTVMRIATFPIDYCNSNWSICKGQRFQVEDLAGNVGTKETCANGPWIRASGGGDIYAAAGIETRAEGAEANAEHSISTGGGMSTFFSSEADWKISNYSPLLSKLSYSEWVNKFPDPTLISVLPTASGIYLIDSSFTIDRDTIPAGLETSAFGAVVFVNGDVIIAEDYELGSEGALLFIVAGNVRVDEAVVETAGFFIVDGNFNTAYNGSADTSPWVLYGGMAAETFTFPRSQRKNGENFKTPAEHVVFQPQYYLLLAEHFTWGRYSWKEK